MTTAIAAGELVAVRELAFKAQTLRAQAAAAAKDVELAQWKLFVRYGLSEADSIDLNTGTITRAPAAAAPPAVDEQEAARILDRCATPAVNEQAAPQ